MTIPSVTIFEDPLLDARLRIDGYCTVPLLSMEEVEELLRIHDYFTPELASDMYTTVYHPDHDHRVKVGRAIDAIIQPHVLPLLRGYKPTASNFVSKRGNTKQGRLPMHQDYTFVDQSRCTGVHIWIPLVDVNENNGCLIIYPGTHSLVNHISATIPRSQSNYGSPYDSVRSLLEENCGVRVPMKAGSAIFFNERTLHASDENATLDKRVAVTSAYIPIQEPMRLYCPSSENPDALDILTLNDPTDLFVVPGEPVPYPYPDYLKYIGTVEYHVEPLSPEQIYPLFRNSQPPVL